MSLSSMIVEDRAGRSFSHFPLDPRLMQGIRELRYREPTLIQDSTIPLALAGQDILARASTGSGKTAAYAIPVCQKLLAAKGDQGLAEDGSTRAMVLVPTRELCHQTVAVFKGLLRHAGVALQVVDVSAIDVAAWGGGRADVVVGTPATVYAHCKQGNISIKGIASCVVDEADALLSTPTVRRLRCMYPTSAQTFLMSATLSPEVLGLKKLLLNKPAVVKLEEEDDGEGEGETGDRARITQYYVPFSDDADRYCYLWSLIRLGHLPGKVLVFVDSVDKAYKLRLFLERFGVKVAVLNHNVPINSRNHIISQYNMGLFSFLIATDESAKKVEQEAREAAAAEAAAAAQRQQKKKPKKRDRDGQAMGEAAAGQGSEYGVSRGIDFREVSAVVSFDLFATLSEQGCKSYIHRIGRTGRAGREGIAVSFVAKADCDSATGWVSYLNDYLHTKGQSITPHPMLEDPQKASALKYRTDDVLSSIKKGMIRDAKIKELAQEALASEKLQQHFSENPSDLSALTHVVKRTQRQKDDAKALSYLPEYLVPGLEGEMQEGGGGAREEATAPAAEEDDDPDAAVPRRKRRRRAEALQRIDATAAGGRPQPAARLRRKRSAPAASPAAAPARSPAAAPAPSPAAPPAPGGGAAGGAPKKRGKLRRLRPKQ